MKRVSITILGFALVLSWGCVSTRRVDVTGSVHQFDPASAVAADANHLWSSAEETLRNVGFKLDRVDQTDGVITTLPMVSQHVTEFWRRDVHSFRALMESTINPIRRWVEVRFDRGENGSWKSVEIVVHKERFSGVDRQFNNSGAAYAFFGDSLPTTTGLAKPPTDAEIWIDLGRDPESEKVLLGEILSNAEAQRETRAKQAAASE